MRLAEFLLAIGFLAAACGAGLCPFVLIGLVGAGLLMGSLGSLVAAGVIARGADETLAWQRHTGLALHGLGVVLLLGSAAHATHLACNQALSLRPGYTAPSQGDWLIVGVSTLAAGLFIAMGLQLRTRLSWFRCFAWGAAALCVVPIGVAIFETLSPVLPLGA